MPFRKAIAEKREDLFYHCPVNTNMYYISVAEPWNFESPDGKNVIKGKIIKIVDNDCVIFKANYPFTEGNVTSELLVLLSRHEGIHFDNIEEKNSWTVDVGLLAANLFNNLSGTDLENNSKYFIIGSLKKE